MRPLLFFLLVVPLAANAFDFKGIAIGALTTPEQINEKLGVKCGAGIEGRQICNGVVTVGREAARMNLVIDKVGIVQRINLSMAPASFDVVAPLLIEKFGLPTSTKTGDLQNRMGAKFEQITHLWQGPGELEVFYTKYAGSIDASTLNFSTKQDRDMLGAGRENRKGDI